MPGTMRPGARLWRPLACAEPWRPDTVRRLCARPTLGRCQAPDQPASCSAPALSDLPSSSWAASRSRRLFRTRLTSGTTSTVCSIAPQQTGAWRGARRRTRRAFQHAPGGLGGGVVLQPPRDRAPALGPHAVSVRSGKVSGDVQAAPLGPPPVRARARRGARIRGQAHEHAVDAEPMRDSVALPICRTAAGQGPSRTPTTPAQVARGGSGHVPSSTTKVGSPLVVPRSHVGRDPPGAPPKGHLAREDDQPAAAWGSARAVPCPRLPAIARRCHHDPHE
jgi:hypothetical protein